jgi:epoxyqueuosine reductase
VGIDSSPEKLIKNAAYEIGFSEVGIAGVTASAESNRVFDRWIERGSHGEMRYLSGGADKRHDPSILLQGAKSVICVAVNYYAKARVEANEARAGSGQGVFSLYVHGRDYHHVLREMLRVLEARLKELFPHARTAICVDTQPISERDFAIRSGVAWLGKNTCVISPDYGSWIFLGELMTDLALKSDSPLETLCGSCTRCVDACPTGALAEEYVLDSTKCISYLTIEKRGEIPAEFHGPIGNHIFGCDICQDVCPFNVVAQESTVFGDTGGLVDLRVEELLDVSDERFLERTADSAVRRCTADGLRRNARIVLANVRGHASGRS